jgi:hypothetical protein
MISVNVDDATLVQWLSDLAIDNNSSIEDVVLKILQFNMAKHSKPTKLSKKKDQSFAQSLINFYKETYRARFSLDTDENISEKLVNDIINKISNHVDNSIETTIDILEKAITWYLFMHKNEDINGGKIPVKFRILLEQSWLLRSCIESSQNLDIAIIQQMALTGLSSKDAAKAIKRGDIMIASNDIPTREQVIKLALKIQSEKDLNDDFKQHPLIRKLFLTATPDDAYIIKAMKFLEKVQSANI